MLNYFNSHPHEEDDYHLLCTLSTLLYFNSHPHEEDDAIVNFTIPARDISTHILTKRMTWFKNQRYCRWIISTHILTKRMTFYCVSLSVLRLFQLTSSRRGWRYLLGMFVIVFVFQLTSSRRGWPFSIIQYFSYIHISTHILTKRMTWYSILTMIGKKHFNSHPHEEDDSKIGTPYVYGAFQLTSSRRGWRDITATAFPFFGISTHILTKRMTEITCNPSISNYISTHILTKRMTIANS